MRRLIGMVAGLLLLGACGTPLTPTPATGPADPDAQLRPDLIVPEVPQVAPGEVVGLSFPGETTRGVLFVLERRVEGGWGAGWNALFYLTSDGPGAGWEREWWRIDTEGMAVPDIGVAGPGPDRVLIPDVAEPGPYRICTGNAGDEICAEIEIVAP